MPLLYTALRPTRHHRLQVHRLSLFRSLSSTMPFSTSPLLTIANSRVCGTRHRRRRRRRRRETHSSWRTLPPTAPNCSFKSRFLVYTYACITRRENRRTQSSRSRYKARRWSKLGTTKRELHGVSMKGINPANVSYFEARKSWILKNHIPVLIFFNYYKQSILFFRINVLKMNIYKYLWENKNTSILFSFIIKSSIQVYFVQMKVYTYCHVINSNNRSPTRRRDLNFTQRANKNETSSLWEDATNYASKSEGKKMSEGKRGKGRGRIYRPTGRAFFSCGDLCQAEWRGSAWWYLGLGTEPLPVSMSTQRPPTHGGRGGEGEYLSRRHTSWNAAQPPRSHLRAAPAAEVARRRGVASGSK